MLMKEIGLLGLGQGHIILNKETRFLEQMEKIQSLEALIEAANSVAEPEVTQEIESLHLSIIDTAREDLGNPHRGHVLHHTILVFWLNLTPTTAVV
jgi:hypothetical protein